MRRRPGPKPRPRVAETISDPYSLAAYVGPYLEHLGVANFSEATIRNVKNNLRHFVAWASERGVVRPADATRAVLERYQRWLYHYRNPETGKPLSTRSQHVALSPLRGFFRWLSKRSLILHNPAAELELPKLDKRLPHAILTLSEVERVMNAPNTKDLLGVRDRAILETLYSTGVRRMELCNLVLHDLDFERGTVLVRRGKGRKDRLIPIGERACLWVRKYLEEVRPRLVMPPDEGRLFVANYGEPFTPKRLTQIAHDYVVAAKIGKPGACHLLRHTMATLMLEGGADIRFIQQMLGHAEISTTQVYTQVSIRALKEVHTATHPGAVLRRAVKSDRDDVAGVVDEERGER